VALSRTCYIKPEYEFGFTGIKVHTAEQIRQCVWDRLFWLFVTSVVVVLMIVITVICIIIYELILK
jgi:hypothetical protein